MARRPRSAWRSGAYWKAQSPGARFRLLGAIFFTFVAVGFLIDLLSPRTISTRELIWNASYSGLFATAVSYAGLRGGLWRLFVVIAFFITFQFAPRLVVHTIRVTGRGAEASLPIERVRFATLGAVISIILSYVMFMQFIRRDGERHVRLRTEVELAKTLHDRLAPPIDLRNERYEFLGRALPSAEIAGDLLDVAGPPDRPVAYVADVTGHGIGAGSVAAMVKSAVRMGLLSRSEMAEVFGDLNRVLLQLDRPGLFVTCAAIALDSGGQARVSLAGHLPVLLVPANGGPVRRIPNGIPPIGVVSEAHITSQDVPCAPGDLFALVTDGIIEVEDRARQEFGLERVERLLCENASRPLAEIADRVFDAAHAHGAQQDDQTLLLVRVL